MVEGKRGRIASASVCVFTGVSQSNARTHRSQRHIYSAALESVLG